MSADASKTNLSRGLIKLCGQDSHKFLQGQVTCDMDHLTSNNSIYGAHCSPNGRVIFLFCAHWIDSQTIILETHPSIVEIAIASLSKYAVFFKTEITDSSNQDLSTEAPLSALERIRVARADISIETSEMFIPQMLNLDAMDYISFKKGCYTGQEVVARAHYRGSVKRRMYHLSLDSQSVPTPGTPIHDGQNKSLGNIVNAAITEDQRIEALATLSAKALDLKSLNIDGATLAVSYLPLPYQIP